MINIWCKFEDKIQNTSKVIVLTRNHTDDDEGTKNNIMSPPPVGDIILTFPFQTSLQHRLQRLAILLTEAVQQISKRDRKYIIQLSDTCYDNAAINIKLIKKFTFHSKVLLNG